MMSLVAHAFFFEVRVVPFDVQHVGTAVWACGFQDLDRMRHEDVGDRRIPREGQLQLQLCHDDGQVLAHVFTIAGCA